MFFMLSGTCIYYDQIVHVCVCARVRAYVCVRVCLHVGIHECVHACLTICSVSSIF